MKTTLHRAVLAAALLAASLCSHAALSASANNGDAMGARSFKTASAMPTPSQIEDAIRAGNYTQAESMLNEVLRDKPNSAKAWYWMAQTQEKLGRSGRAEQALSKAEQLAPDLKFASPGAVADMRARLNQGSRVANRPQTAPQAIPGYASRAPVGSDSASRTASPAAPAKPASHAWIYVLILLVGAGGGLWYFMSKRSKQQASDEQERDRKALLARANSAQERASALSKTARFESQESSAFGVAAAGLLSRANSALSRLKSSGASIDSLQERRDLEIMESDLEHLETQAARKAWTEEHVPASSAPAQSSAAASESFGNSSSSMAPGYPQGSSGFGGYGAPVQAGPSTVVVNQGSSGSGLLETMMIANVLQGSHHNRDREYDLERENQRLRESQHGSGNAASPSAAPASSGFDLGGGGSDAWDSSSSSSSAPVDTGPSSDSSWDSGSSSDSSSSDSSSSDSSSSSSDDSSW